MNSIETASDMETEIGEIGLPKGLDILVTLASCLSETMI
jgi:hypothetical protein